MCKNPMHVCERTVKLRNDADFTKGVLTVHAPKVGMPKPRKVAIATKA
jgi:hypothetical protein